MEPALVRIPQKSFAGWQVVCRCEMSAVFPVYCAGVLGHNFDLNFDATQTAEECNALKNSSEYLGCIDGLKKI